MTCTVVRACKTADEVVPWGFDFTAWLTNEWSSGTVFLLGQVVRPSESTGYEYVSSGGQAGEIEPFWADGVVDGSITWTAQAISNDSLRSSISNSAWSASSDDIVITGEQLIDTDGMQITSALIGGGISGQAYDVFNVVTMDDGSIEANTIHVTVD